jgi:hypothetical protein
VFLKDFLRVKLPLSYKNLSLQNPMDYPVKEPCDPYPLDNYPIK